MTTTLKYNDRPGLHRNAPSEWTVESKSDPEKDQASNESERDDPEDPDVEEQKSDLLLELAMTTAFASLTDGTPILEASSVTSYLCFFALVWWVWASQVAYNVRFCTNDWLRRAFVCAQLVIFGALAAFTNDFDVFSGIGNNDSQQSVLTMLQQDEFAAGSNIAAGNARQLRLPTLNARGISIVMALSRLVLLAQYVCALLRPENPAGHEKPRPVNRTGYRRFTITVHIFNLAFSSVCYFVAYGVISKTSPSSADQIGKLILWYMPLLIEVGVHFLLVLGKDSVRYPPSAIFKRSVTLFTVVLGGGLDHITNGFQFIVGNDSTGTAGAGLIISGAVIFLAQFALYFGLRKDQEFTGRRVICGILPWFFGHFSLLCATVVTLQATAQMLQYGNIVVALQTPHRFVQEFNTTLQAKGLDFLLVQQTDFPDLIKPLNDIGVSVQAAIDFVSGILQEVGEPGKNAAGPENAIMQYGVAISRVVLQNLNADPSQGTELYERMSLFIGYSPFNASFINVDEYNIIMKEVYVTHATPAVWFFGAAGATLIFLAMLAFLKPRKLGPFEKGVIVTRLVFGIATVCLSALDSNEGNTIVDSSGNLSGSKIWNLASRSWVLPIFAILLVAELICEYAMHKTMPHTFHNDE